MIQEITDYLLDNYYIHYEKPDRETLFIALTNHIDKVVTLNNVEGITGVAIYLTLSDETYKDIANIDISSVKTLTALLEEDGNNIHFILVATHGFENIRAGLRDVVSKVRPKTVSWYDIYGQLHKYSMRG